MSLGVTKVVDQNHDFGAVSAGVLADRRALPVDPVAAGILGVERAFAVAQAGNECAAGILAQNVAVRAPLLLERVFDDARQALGDGAEETDVRPR